MHHGKDTAYKTLKAPYNALACMAPTMLEELYKQAGSNIVGYGFGDNGTIEMMGVDSSKV